MVSLNVGGTRYTTSVDTLVKDRHSRLAMLFQQLNGRHVKRQSDGVVFLDADSRAFELVLAWLRHGIDLNTLDGYDKQRERQHAMIWEHHDILRLLNDKGGPARGRRGRRVSQEKVALIRTQVWMCVRRIVIVTWSRFDGSLLGRRSIGEI